MFQITQAVLTQRIELLRASMGNKTEELKGLDSTRDGDMMDDGVMHRLLDQRLSLEGEAILLARYLGTEIKIINGENISEINTVQVGHEVKLKTTYTDGLIDDLNVTIGTTIDAKYLLALKDGPFKGNNILISDESPLGKQLIGKSVNDTFAYQVGNETNKATVLGIKISPLVLNK